MALNTQLTAVIEEIDLAGVEYKAGNPHRYFDETTLKFDVLELEVNLPEEDDAEALARGLTYDLKYGRTDLSVDELVSLQHLTDVAVQVAENFNERIKDKIEAAQKAAEEAERKVEEDRKQREVNYKERKERLLTEFLEEHGRIRTRRSKTYQPVVVKAERAGVDSDEFDVRFEWVNNHDWGRQRNLGQVVSFDIKVGKRYYRVWDDGTDDLYGYDAEEVAKARKKVPQYEGQLG